MSYIGFIANSILFGVALAMDAFSVSVANGINDPRMKRSRAFTIAGCFAFFQILMPLAGWFCVRKIATAFSVVQGYIPYIAFLLLLFIGVKMILEGQKNKDAESAAPAVGLYALLLQGIATSMDALSVGLTISDYNAVMALAESLIIGAVTLVICLAGLLLGKRIGTRISGAASLLGGSILIIIGIKILVSSL